MPKTHWLEDAQTVLLGDAMQEHVHTGFVSFVFAGVSAVIFIQMMRLAAAYMVTKSSLEPAGKVIGGLVHFSS